MNPSNFFTDEEREVLRRMASLGASTKNKKFRDRIAEEVARDYPDLTDEERAMKVADRISEHMQQVRAVREKNRSHTND